MEKMLIAIKEREELLKKHPELVEVQKKIDDKLKHVENREERAKLAFELLVAQVKLQRFALGELSGAVNKFKDSIEKLKIALGDK